MEKDNSERTRFLAVDECKVLIDACPSYFRPVVVMALTTGMRKREILKLSWDRVDLEHDLILLRAGETKNEDSRKILIVPDLKRILENLPRYVGCPYVFPNTKTMAPFFSGDKPFAAALKKAGIIDFRFHDLRHTYASHLVMSGVDLTTVMHLMGHKSLKMTLRYAHLAPSHKEKAMLALGQRFQGVF